jgi:hypothetical protein
MTCYNCTNPALYYVNDPTESPAAYCNTCLPPWLKVRADEGHFPLPVEKKSSKKASDKDEDK